MDLRALDTIASHFPGVHLASASDNEELLAFLRATPMRAGGMVLGYRRDPDFFRLLRYQGDEAATFCGVNADGRLDGLGSVSFRAGTIEGHRVRVAYAGDLRVRSKKWALATWRPLLVELVSTLPERVLTAVLDGNSAAQRALVGPQRRPRGFRYAPISHYRIHYVAARLFATTGKGISVRRARAEDATRLLRFFAEDQRDRPFGFTEDELPRRLATWDRFGIDSFWVAEGAQRELLGMAAPWRPDAAKQMSVESLPAAAGVLRQAARLVRRGDAVPLPKAGEVLESSYLTHLTLARGLAPARRGEVFRALLGAAYDHEICGGRAHLLGFAEHELEPIPHATRGYLGFKEAATLYEILPEGRAAVPPGTRAPGFEMALV